MSLIDNFENSLKGKGKRSRLIKYPDDEVDDSSFDDDLKDLSSDDGLDDDIFKEDLSSNFNEGGSVPIEKHNDLLKSLTNFDKFVREKVNGWLGLVWDEKEDKYVQNPQIQPIMNVRCANWCIDFLKTYTRENNIITNISERDYKFICYDIIEVLWLNIGCRADTDFGIQENGDIIRICNEMEHAAILVLMGAGNGKYNEFLGTVTNRSESVNVNQMNPNQGQMGGQYMPGGRVGLVEKVRRKLVG